MRYAAIFLLAVVALPLRLMRAGDAPSPVVVLDCSKEKDVGEGASFQHWFDAKRWVAEFGTPAYFFLRGGSLRLVARPGENAKSWNPFSKTKREDKVLLRIT